MESSIQKYTCILYIVMIISECRCTVSFVSVSIQLVTPSPAGSKRLRTFQLIWGLLLLGREKFCPKSEIHEVQHKLSLGYTLLPFGLQV